ncbi:kinase-like domain-containing protein [Trichoderma barbatum]
MAATANTLPRDVPFVSFSAANDAATLLFELIQAKSLPPNLVSDENSIGFQISLPLSSDNAYSDGPDNSSETSSDADLDSNRIEWEIGSGTSPAMMDKGLGRSNPPILLCPLGATLASQTVRKYIKDVHACIFFHPNSGVLMLKALCNRPIIYEQGDMHDNDLKLGLDEWGDGMTCVLRRERNYIRIGPYRFLLKFKTQSRETYQRFTAHMNENMKSEYHGLVPSCLFNFIPMAPSYNKTSWNVWVHQQIPTTDITTGVNIHTGEPVAIKILRNRDIIHVRQHIVNQLQMAVQNKDKQESGILGIFDVWCDHQTSPPCLLTAHDLRAECHHTHYSMPLASYTRKLRLDSETLATQKVVLSLSMSQMEKKMFDRTRICVAPEVWRNGGVTTDLDGTKLDIWAMASSWLYAFAKPPNREIATKDTHKWLQGQLDRISKLKPLTNLLRKMLAWEPQDRPTVAEALASDAWQFVRTEKQKVEDKKKRKREAKMQSDGAKRVRVLSPGKENYKIFKS